MLLNQLIILKNKNQSLDLISDKADFNRALNILKVEWKNKKVVTNSKKFADIIKKISKIIHKKTDK